METERILVSVFKWDQNRHRMTQLKVSGERGSK